MEEIGARSASTSDDRAGDTPPESVARKAGRAAHPQNLVERRLTKFLHAPPSVRLAANVIVTATLLIVVVGGVMMRVLDHKEYASVWLGMWWVLETVTTVGYGDLTPESAIGKILTSLVMLWGVAFLAIITAAITSVFVARAQRERAERTPSTRPPAQNARLAIASTRSTRSSSSYASCSSGRRRRPERQRRRRASSASPSVPVTVSTSFTALPPRSFDSPPARGAMFTGTSSSAQPRVDEADQGLDLGRTARVRLGEQRQRLRVHRVEAARRVAERPPQDDARPSGAAGRCRDGAPGSAGSGTARSRSRRRSGSRPRRRTRPLRTRSSSRASSCGGCWPSASTRPQNA